MNRRMIAYVLGTLLLLEGALMLPSCIVAVIYKEAALNSFLITIAISVAAGALLVSARPQNKTIYAREGIVIVALGWIIFSLVGALPFFFSREIPSYLDAVFESVSGFTTTGSSILTDVESLSRCILFWRSFTHWIGGMGVLVFMMAVLPLAGGGGDLHLMRAESPGPDVGKLVPKSKSTARILYGIYIVMTVIEIILLKFGGVGWLDSLMLTFGSAGTGGFGIRNTSCAEFSSYAQTVITVSMAMFGINFNLYFLLLCGKLRDFFKSEELRGYLGIMLGTIAIITINIRNLFPTIKAALHAAAFQVSSVMTTTGYTTVNYDEWPVLSQMLMLMVMCVGACAGSTAGGIKVSRILLMIKSAKREVRRIAHPRSINVVTFDGKRVSDDVMRGTYVFFILYMMIFVVSLVLVCLDSTDMISNISGVIATLNNIGPGLNLVGATGSFAGFSWLSKSVFIANMLFGRLEIFPLILLFVPRIGIERARG